MEHKEHIWLEGVQNGAITLEISLAVSYQVKYIVTIWPSDFTPRHLPKGTKKVY